MYVIKSLSPLRIRYCLTRCKKPKSIISTWTTSEDWSLMSTLTSPMKSPFLISKYWTPSSSIDSKLRNKNYKIKSGSNSAKTSKSGIKASRKISPTTMNGLTPKKNIGKTPKSQSINKKITSSSFTTPSKNNYADSQKKNNFKNKDLSIIPLKWSKTNSKTALMT